MNVIEKHVHEHFASLAENGSTDEPITNGNSITDAISSTTVPQVLGPPFAKVNSVSAGGPADSAGVKAGDEIRNFGYVNISNHEGLRRVGECVQGNEGVRTSLHYGFEVELFLTSLQREILVKISRPTTAVRRQELQLMLTPRGDWGGRGLLGCHILPL